MLQGSMRFTSLGLVIAGVALVSMSSAQARLLMTLTGDNIAFRGGDFGTNETPELGNLDDTGGILDINLDTDIEPDGDLDGSAGFDPGPGNYANITNHDYLRIEIDLTVYSANVADSVNVVLVDDLGDFYGDEYHYNFSFSGKGVPANTAVTISDKLRDVTPVLTQAAYQRDSCSTSAGACDETVLDNQLRQLQLQMPGTTTLTEHTIIDISEIRVVDFSDPSFTAVDDTTATSFTWGAVGEAGAFDNTGGVISIDTSLAASNENGGVGYNRPGINFDPSEYELFITAKRGETNTAENLSIILQDTDVAGSAVPDPENPPANPRQIEDFVFDIPTDMFSTSQFTTVAIPLGTGSESAVEAAFESLIGDSEQNFGLTQMQIQDRETDPGFDLIFEVASWGIRQALIPGDTDLDGDVDLDDYDVMSGNMYTAVANGYLDGDFNNDGFVDFEDFVLQALNFGDTPDFEDFPVAEQLGSLPEPGALALMLIGGVAAGARGRRR